MKKLLPIVLLLALLPAVVAAQVENQTKVKSIDLTINVPSAGMTKAEGAKMALTAANTAYGDLFAKQAVSIRSITWNGEFDLTDRRAPKFQPGYTYEAVIKLAFKADGAYAANYVMKDGNYHVDGTSFSATVNGQTARIMDGTVYFPTVIANLTIAGEMSGAAAEAVAAKRAKSDAARRATTSPLTTAEADALWVGKQAYDVIVVDRNNKPSLSANDKEYPCQKSLFITKLIVDLGGEDPADKNYVNGIAGDLVNFLAGPYNLKEVWLSDKVDIPAFVKSLHETMDDKLYPGYMEYWDRNLLFMSGEATLCIPESAVPAVKAIVSANSTQPVYTIKTYSDDVYSAQKAGVGAAKEWCHQHRYTKQIMSADRVCHYEDCSHDLQWYYSCAICGKCEHNDKHTFSRFPGFTHEGPVGKAGHTRSWDLATDAAYIGVNAAGDHLWWKSCQWCGRPARLTEKDRGEDVSLRESRALILSRAAPGMFTLPQKSTAKISPKAQDGVNRALNDNLIDTDLLGADYTKPATRLQLASIAVRLAEELTGKSIAPASAFSDTRNDYAGKAAAMGLTDDIADGAFSPDAAVSREELATFIYRTLRYVEKNSDYGYTDYTSKLSSYSDNGQIAAWAQEPMAFMNALELIEGTSATTLGPKETCTIEQVLVVAEHSVYAHQIGWYQAIASGERRAGFISVAGADNCYHYGPGGASTAMGLALSDRIWVIGSKVDGWLPTRDPYTGQTFYMEAKWFHPIREKGAPAKSAATAKSGSSKPAPAASGTAKQGQAKPADSGAAKPDSQEKAKSAVKDAVKKGLGGLLKKVK